jgi:hypothetical protein
MKKIFRGREHLLRISRLDLGLEMRTAGFFEAAEPVIWELKLFLHPTNALRIRVAPPAACT